MFKSWLPDKGSQLAMFRAAAWADWVMVTGLIARVGWNEASGWIGFTVAKWDFIVGCTDGTLYAEKDVALWRCFIAGLGSWLLAKVVVGVRLLTWVVEGLWLLTGVVEGFARAWFEDKATGSVTWESIQLYAYKVKQTCTLPKNELLLTAGRLLGLAALRCAACAMLYCSSTSPMTLTSCWMCSTVKISFSTSPFSDSIFSKWGIGFLGGGYWVLKLSSLRVNRLWNMETCCVHIAYVSNETSSQKSLPKRGNVSSYSSNLSSSINGFAAPSFSNEATKLMGDGSK